ncbi:MAG: 50S ribosomal protein L21 [Minisyncoccia bacterium]|jgi:large subunit ribosomal protein L21
MIAVIETSGKQFLVKEGNKILINKTDKKEGEEIIFDKVLLVKNNNIKIGKPYVENAKVVGKVIRKIKKKILIIKFKPKTRYRKRKGYKYYFDEVLIEKILI